MAVNPMQPFVWGRGGQQLSYEALMRLRDQEAQQQGQGVDFSPVGHWTQGLARVANALVGSVRRGQIDSQLSGADANGADRVKAWFGGGHPTPPIASASPDAPASVAPVVGDDIRTGIIQTAQALGIDPVDLATTISYETGGTFDPTKTGPTTQWGQHRGLIQFGEPQAKQYGVDWNNPVGSQLGPNGAVANYLRSTGVQPGMGLMDIYSAINAGGVGRYGASDANNGGAPGTVADKVNNQMAGHRQKAMALLGGGGDSPAQLQTMGGDAPMMPAAAQPAVQVASADNSDMNPILMALAKRGGALPDQQAAPVQQIARGLTNSQPAPQQMAQAGPNQQELIEAYTNPMLPPQVRSLAASLLQSQMQAQQQANDPLRRLQLERAELENERLRQQSQNGPDETFFGNPVAMTNPDGSIGYGQIGNRGTFRPIQLGQGQSFAPPTRNIDAGNETVIVDQAGNVISRVPKNSFQPAFDAASGSAQGTASGGATAAAPQDYQAAQNALDLIDNIKNDPYRSRGTGFSSYGNVIRGTGGYDFQNKVDQAKSGAFLTAIQQMRGLGALSNAEGDAATSAITRMDTATSEEGFLAALDDYKKIVEQGKARAEKRMGGAPAQPAAGSGTGDGGWTTLPNGVRIRQKAP